MTEEGDGERFSPARWEHERILADPASAPDGWVEQARFRDRYDLPPFRPPRFIGDTRVRTVVSALEAEHGVEVAFVERDVESGWSVEIDGTHAFSVQRRRDAATNVVIGMSAAAFEHAVRSALQS